MSKAVFGADFAGVGRFHPNLKLSCMPREGIADRADDADRTDKKGSKRPSDRVEIALSVKGEIEQEITAQLAAATKKTKVSRKAAKPQRSGVARQPNPGIAAKLFATLRLPRNSSLTVNK